MVRESWTDTNLGDVTEWTSGGTPPKSEAAFWNGNIPWISASSMKEVYLSNSDRKLSELGLAAGSRLAPEEAVLLLVRGSELHKRVPIGIATRDVAFNQDVKALKTKKQLLPRYLLYWLLGNEPLLLSKVEHTGIGAGKLDTDVMKSLPLSLPPLPVQRNIVSMISALDEKIELNRRMNEMLEEMARAIFKSWFVDFDPVRAKAEGGKPYGMDAETASLFPDLFEDSLRGEIPKGWSAGTVGDDFDVTMGQSPPGDTYNEVGVGLPFYQGRRDFKFRYPTLRVYCSAPKRRAQDGDTLVSVRAPVGDTNMAESLCCVGRGVAAVRHKTGSRSYTYYSMTSLKPYFEQFESEGTVFGAVNKQGFITIPIPLPPTALIEKFEKIASPLDQLIEVQEKQSRTLATIRDALLPKLLSGEIKVSDVEDQMEEAV